MRTSVFVGTSVDGFIARRNGDFDFLPEGGGEPHGYDEFMSNVDVLEYVNSIFSRSDGLFALGLPSSRHPLLK